jgi:hypothetical protein
LEPNVSEGLRVVEACRLVTGAEGRVQEIVLLQIVFDARAPIDEVVVDLVVLRHPVEDRRALRRRRGPGEGVPDAVGAAPVAFAVQRDALLLLAARRRRWRVIAERDRDLVPRAEALDAVEEQVDAVFDAVARPIERRPIKPLVTETVGPEAPERRARRDARGEARRR